MQRIDQCLTTALTSSASVLPTPAVSRIEYALDRQGRGILSEACEAWWVMVCSGGSRALKPLRHCANKRPPLLLVQRG